VVPVRFGHERGRAAKTMAHWTHRIEEPGHEIDLAGIDTVGGGSLTKDQAADRFAKVSEELEELQGLLFAAAQNSLLVILQGRDTAGKDGAVKTLSRVMNPVGVRVVSFKPPTEPERAHDFLWRVHAEVPRQGEVAFFNRSHYEDVLVARVHNLVPEERWRGRYEHINAFEHLLTDSGTIIVKLLLNISREEQERRLLAREEANEKAWKLSASDWVDRARWDDYSAAYADVLARCAAPHAPWYIVPADRKWFRNLAIAEVLVEAMRPYRASWEAYLADLGAKQKTALALLRSQMGEAGQPQ
jgi:PPK2 family polyphosphate:nucleotide phosphotransferase